MSRKREAVNEYLRLEKELNRRDDVLKNSLEEIASSGFPENQVCVRAAELAKEKFVTSPKKGTYVAVAHKVEALLEL